jgi:stage II sporulation protein D
MTVVERDLSGRIRILSITDADGRKVQVKGSRFRMAVGPDLVKSARFEPEVLSDRVSFTGTGWGHGVGLCQEGAEGMARAGYNAFEILRKYYPGVIKERLK